MMIVAPLAVLFATIVSACRAWSIICPKCKTSISPSDCNGRDGFRQAYAGEVVCRESKPGQRVPTQCGIMDTKDERKAKPTIQPGGKGSSGILGTGDTVMCKTSGESFEIRCLEVVDKSDKSLVKVCPSDCAADAASAAETWQLSKDKKYGIKCGSLPSFIPDHCSFDGDYRSIAVFEQKVYPGKPFSGRDGMYSFHLKCVADLATLSLKPFIEQEDY